MEGRYRSLLEAAPDAMVVVNGAGEIVLLNLQAEKQFGYHRDELVGQQVTNIIPEGFAERLIADGLLSAADALARQIGTGIELVALRKDGTEFPIELMLSPLEGSAGILVTAAIRDISVRKAAEERLAHLAALVESSDEAIFSKALDGTVLSWNRGAEKLYGYTPQQIVGRPISLLLPPDRPHEVEDMIERLQRGEAIEHFETVRVCKSGSLIDVSVTVSPIKDAYGKIIGASTIARDISVRKTAEARRSNRELQDFATVASHDLQEPLRKIEAFGDRLEERLSNVMDEESAEYLRRMKAAAARMQTLINDLLAYSQVAIRPEPPQAVDLGRVVSDVLLDLDERIRSTKGQVHVGPLPTLLAGPLQMRQLFQNLISNALKFHPEGVAPEVHVEAVARSAARRQGHAPVWEIRVRDNGIGFDEEYAEKIFAPLQRLNGRQEFEGTGMGLAICRKIVVLCGGTITATSHPGAGATFVITLPRTAAPPRR
jgi:PAS domain S-box-containing protein